jgi:hypothetical protein
MKDVWADEKQLVYRGLATCWLTYICRVEYEWVWCPLRPTPERLTRAGNMILRETVEELSDSVVKLLLKLQTSPDDTLLESQRLVGNQIRNNLGDVIM